MQKKNNHTHKTVFTWFDNLLTFIELQEFYYYQGKIQVRQYSFFLLSKTISRNPNFQNNGFYILRIEFTMGYKTGQIFFPKGFKPPLHELSFRKSPIKNHTILFRVGSSSGSNVTRFHKSQHSRPHKDSDCITNAACKCI